MIRTRRLTLQTLILFTLTAVAGTAVTADENGASGDDGRSTPAAAPEKQAEEQPPQAAEAAAAESPSSDSAAPTDEPPKRRPNRLQALEEKLDQLAAKIEQIGAPAAQPEPDSGSEEAAEAAPQEDDPDQPQTRPDFARRNSLPDVKPAPAMKLKDEWLKAVPWRSVGPANMSGRVTDLVVHEKDASLWWIGTATGGLLKSTNHGTTVEHQFDHETTVSVGAVATDPGNPDVLWVGTGEANPRNSVSYGDGVYKSTDGGRSWEHKGLKDSFQIGRIVVHPKDSDTVYVAALGRLWGPNRERGVFRTTDGGDTWEHVLYVDDRTGCIDLVMNPQDPNVLVAAMWDRERDGFDSWPGREPRPEGVDGYDPLRKWGPGGGIYRSDDGGTTWSKISAGLPTSPTGRIGLDWQSGGSHTLVAIIDCEDIGKGPKPFDAYLGLVGENHESGARVIQVLPESPAAVAGAQVGDIIASVNDQEIADFDQFTDLLREKKPAERFSFSLKREDATVDVSVVLGVRPGAGDAPRILLGVSGEDTDDEGIRITAVTEDGPAAKAGLQKDDVIRSIEGKPMTSIDDMTEFLQAQAVGDEITVEAGRGEETIESTAVLAAAPQRTQGRSGNAFMGIRGESAGDDKGARLTTITDGGPSEEAGLKEGDIVIEVEKQKITTYEQLIAEIRKRQPDDEMKIKVRRGEKTVPLTVTLGDRNGGSSRLRPYTYSYFGQRPNVQDQQGGNGRLYGGIYKSTDGGKTWQRINSLNTRPMYFSVIRIDPQDDQRLYVLAVSQWKSEDGGATFTPNFGNSVHADGHDLWIDPADGRHMLLGGDGGIYVTWDYGSRWDHINTAAIGQFYHVAISPQDPYWVVGGLQDNGSWAGPAISRSGGSVNEDWIRVGGGDGFVCRVDPQDPYLMYYESQNGAIARRHLQTGESASVRPPRIDGVGYRFNWKTPFIVSGHNPQLFYSAGNYVFRSLKRGADLKIISPELTRTPRGSATALSESPRDSDVLYAGTDDGALWVTTDGGERWKDISRNETLPQDMWVSSIEASRFFTGRVYVCFDGHRSDDDQPYLFVSDDFGDTFRPLHGGLPRGSSRCLREDIVNENLLYAGTEFGFYVSADRGRNWTAFNQTLPTVPVFDVASHPAVNEVVLATHGRSLWAADVSALRRLTPKALSEEITFLPPNEVTRWRREPSRGTTNRRFTASNPAFGAQFWYTLPKDAEEVSFRIEDVKGEFIALLKGETKAGLHRVNWNLARTAEPGRQNQQGGRGRRPSPGFRGNPAGRPVPTAPYRVTLMVNGEAEGSHVISIRSDPALPADAVADEVYEEMLLIEESASKTKSAAKDEGRDVWKAD